jgi:hypothetical protein
MIYTESFQETANLRQLLRSLWQLMTWRFSPTPALKCLTGQIIRPACQLKTSEFFLFFMSESGMQNI